MLVTAIAVVSAVVLAKDLHEGRGRLDDPLEAAVFDVTAQQFAWLFKYPAYHATSSTLPPRAHDGACARST